MKYLIYRIVKFILYPIFILVYRPTFIGRNNIPKEGPVILAGNHTGILDAALMIAGPKRIVHMMAKKEIFKSKISSMFFRSMGCISVDRSKHDEKAKSEAIEVLKRGELLGIFPEGTVNKTKDVILPFKYGAVSFALKTDAYIVPFAITGKYKPFRKSIRIEYGNAYKLDHELGSENKRLENKVKNLILKGDKYENK